MKTLNLIFVATFLGLSFAQASQIQESLEFRNIFAGYIQDRQSVDSTRSYIYLPVQQLLNPPSWCLSSQQCGGPQNNPQVDLPRRFFYTLQKRLVTNSLITAVKATQLYRLGVDQSLEPIASKLSTQWIGQLASQSTGRLPLIVIVPGVFGEMIATHAFEEIYSNPSALRDRYQKALTIEDSQKLKIDGIFSLGSMRAEARPMSDLLQLGTLYGLDQSPLADVLLFNTELMSLESMGDITQRAAAFNRRLAKFFTVMGTPPQVLLIGYSRGTMVGLEMLSQASRQKAPWLNQVMGLVALGGVTYGSDLADVALNVDGSNRPVAQQLASLTKLRQSLNLLKDRTPYQKDLAVNAKIASENAKIDLENKKTWEQNSAAWLKFFVEMGKTINPSPNDAGHSTLVEAKAKADELLEQLKLQKGVNLGAVIKLGEDIFFNTFDLFKKRKLGYNDRIVRFQRLVDEALIAVRQLGTEERLQWWKTHTIPVGSPEHPIYYYSLPAVMSDPSQPGSEEYNLGTNRLAYNTKLYDFAALKKNFLEFKNYTGIQVNDSQVAVQKVRFWPELATTLNPAQEPYRSKFLGVLGVHHWGLALQVVNEMKDGSKDPYPRVDLLRAILAQAAKDRLNSGH